MSTQAEPQQQYGNRLLPSTLDEEARITPERIFASYSISDDLSEGFQDVTFFQMASAVDCFAHKLREMFGVSQDFETLTYLGVPDLRYNIVFYAAVKCGYKVFLPSPRNPASTNLALIQQTNSRKLVHAPELQAVINKITDLQEGITCAAVGPLKTMLQSHGPSFRFCPPFEEAIHQPILVLHSSGSTGLPKPVTMTHGSFAAIDNDRNFPVVPGRKNNDLTVWDFEGSPGRLYEPFPPFHLAGFFSKIMVPVFTRAIPIFGPPLRPPSGTLTAEILQRQSVRGCLLPPSVAEQLLSHSQGLDLFEPLDFFCFAGGPLSDHVGDLISKKTTVCQFYGSTEVGQIRQLVPRPEDWSYMEFHPDAKLSLEPFDDNVFELVLYADDTTKSSSMLNHNCPDTHTWPTKDLFTPHPSKKGLWRFHGRKDDIIVLSNGEKLNPVPMERYLQGLPNISGALVVGHARSQPALLIEPAEQSSIQDKAWLDEVWPMIEKANAMMPGHGRIVRSLMVMANAEKPFIRAGKGTIVRKLTEAAYTDAIDHMYSKTAESTSIPRSVLHPTAFTRDATTHLIQSILLDIVHGPVGISSNLYSNGLDSLKTMEAVEALRLSLSSHRESSKLSWLTAETFYRHPSILQLSQVVVDFLNEGKVPEERNRNDDLSKLYNNFAKTLESSAAIGIPEPRAGGITLILTGTTGNLGSRLLREFAMDSKVASIYCFNRSTHAERKWSDGMTCESTSSAPITAEVKFLTVDFGQAHLGLRPEQLAGIVDRCSLIVHTAWKVDFNQSLASFADNIRSVCTLANAAITSSQRPRIVFVSSISSVGPWNSAYRQGPGIPEEPIEDLSAALSVGYGESKQIAERLLDRAAGESNLPVTILRVGYLGGAIDDVQAPWTGRELFPAILKACKLIGLVPTDLPPVDWIPVDKASKIVSEISFHDLGSSSPTKDYYHVVNPHPRPWLDFMPCLMKFCGQETKAVPLSEWVAHLRRLSERESISSVPSLKLLGFFSLMQSGGAVATYQTSAIVRASGTMFSLQPVDQTLMDHWLSQYTF
ncbi:MAG: hypothetical protein Q9183_002448 [Haloplaca sp. 2 TL-2023]